MSYKVFLDFSHSSCNEDNTKNFFIAFFQKKLKITPFCLDFYEMGAWIHSFLTSEVKDVESQVLQAFEKTPNKKKFEVSSWIQVQQFSRQEKWKSFRLIVTIFSLLELSLFEFGST